MPQRKQPRPTDAQLAILKVLWNLEPATVRQVHEALPDEVRRTYTTTLKLMQVMAEKGIVRRDESARSHVYTSNVSERETQARLVGDLMTKAFSGSAAKLVMRALSDERASEQELREIQNMIEQLRRGKGGPTS